MALTLERGSFVKFQYDLGTGPIEITNWAVRVQPGHWYTAYATRSVIVICFFLKNILKEIETFECHSDKSCSGNQNCFDFLFSRTE